MVSWWLYLLSRDWPFKEVNFFSVLLSIFTFKLLLWWKTDKRRQNRTEYTFTLIYLTKYDLPFHWKPPQGVPILQKISHLIFIDLLWKKKKIKNAEEFSTEVENGQDCFFFWCCQVHNLIRQQHNKPIITRKRFFPLITYVHQRSGMPCQHDQIKEYSLFLTAPLLITYVSWPKRQVD